MFMREMSDNILHKISKNPDIEVGANELKKLLGDVNRVKFKELLYNLSFLDKFPIEIALENDLYHIALLYLKYGSPIPRKPYGQYMNFYGNGKLICDRVSIWYGDIQTICPITREYIIEPAVLEDGSTYEKNAILEWFYTTQLDLSRFDLYASVIAREINKDNYEYAQQTACNQWHAMCQYISPMTGGKIIREPVIFLPKTDDFIII